MGGQGARVRLLLLLSALAASGSETIPSSEPAAASTAPARPAAPLINPWELTYGVDRRGQRYGRLDYRLRWSFDDLKKAPRELEHPARGVEETMRGLLQGSRIDLYGVRVRPFRDLPLLPPLDAAAVTASSAAARGAAPAPARRRRSLYSWDRLYEDLEDSARRETERFLVREGFDRALPSHSGVPFDQKRALGSGLLDLGKEGLGEREGR
jgi:hypothetical protein